jgi:hypothetical protein
MNEGMVNRISGGKAASILEFDKSLRMCDHLHAPAALLPEKEPQHPFDFVQSGRVCEEENLCSWRESNPGRSPRRQSLY